MMSGQLKPPYFPSAHAVCKITSRSVYLLTSLLDSNRPACLEWMAGCSVYLIANYLLIIQLFHEYQISYVCMLE
ncbi:uncharacterized protein An16g07600 [Aspergillus niger]|uniref:Contig An16c0230, genomic contig n=2 Tax=Aspergillus niger TaxID=5061 RepID=A2R8L7_ASPNC|nr:uncharacterized protein An16g07600 [Aspergillus niger]CAL00532.1 unnamed protein product [Aspergillus niger]